MTLFACMWWAIARERTSTHHRRRRRRALSAAVVTTGRSVSRIVHTSRHSRHLKYMFGVRQLTGTGWTSTEWQCGQGGRGLPALTISSGSWAMVETVQETSLTTSAVDSAPAYGLSRMTQGGDPGIFKGGLLGFD